MCQKAPGPRCAPHAKAQMESSRHALAQVESELETALSSSRLTHVKANGFTTTSLDRSSEEQAHIDSLLDQVTVTRRKYELARLDYYGTPTGNRDLKSVIHDADKSGNAATVRDLNTLMMRASMLRAWRKNAMNRTFDPVYYAQSVA